MPLARLYNDDILYDSIMECRVKASVMGDANKIIINNNLNENERRIELLNESKQFSIISQDDIESIIKTILDVFVQFCKCRQ